VLSISGDAAGRRGAHDGDERYEHAGAVEAAGAGFAALAREKSISSIATLHDEIVEIDGDGADMVIVDAESGGFDAVADRVWDVAKEVLASVEHPDGEPLRAIPALVC
jgi:hypothetical protein